MDRFSITEEGEWEEQETEAVLFIPAGYKDSDEYKASEEWFLFDLAYRAEMADRCGLPPAWGPWTGRTMREPQSCWGTA